MGGHIEWTSSSRGISQRKYSLFNKALNINIVNSSHTHTHELVSWPKKQKKRIGLADKHYNNFIGILFLSID